MSCPLRRYADISNFLHPVRRMAEIGPKEPVRDRQLLGELQPVSRFVPRLAAFESLAVVFCVPRPAADDPKLPFRAAKPSFFKV
jgi:hypothetical protein